MNSMHLFVYLKNINKNSIINLISKLIDFFILLTIGLAPIYFAFIYKDYSVFTLDKVVLFRLLTEILLLLYIIKIVLSRQIKLTLNKWQIILPALFFLSYFLATIFSTSPYTSFWGHYWRQQGLFTYLHYFLFFLLVGLNYDFIQEKKQKRFLAVILISSFIICVYGIIQYLGLDWHKWGNILLLQRVNSTLGQPNFLGAYLVLIIPLSVFALYKFKNYYIRLIIGVILFSQFLTLFLTYSRSAWIGITLVCLLGFGYFLYFKQYKKILVIFIVLIALFSVLVSGIIVSGGIDFDVDKEFNFKNRLKSFLVLDRGSNKARLDNYNLATNAIILKPILGYGPETMWLWSAKFYNKELAVYEKINTYFDRSHNEILDIIIFTGFAGLFCYLLLLFYLFIRALKVLLKTNYYKNGKNNFLFLFFSLIAVLAYFVTIQLGFSITTTNIYFWLYLAIIFLLINQITGHNNKIIFISIRPVIKYSSIFLFFLCTVYIVWQFNINKVLADIYFYKAMSGVIAHDNFNEVNDDFLKSLQYNPREDFYRARYADKLISTAKTIETCEEKNQLLISANSFLQEIPEDRRDINMRVNLVKAKAFYYYCQNYNDFSEIDKMYEDAVSFSPQLASLRLDGGDMYYQIGDYKKAITNFEYALKLYPNLTDSRINREHREQIKEEMIVVYKLLGDTYRQVDNYDQALENYLKANKLLANRINFDLRNKISAIYLIEEEYDKAIALDEHNLILSGGDIYYKHKLMQDYKLVGDIDKAKQYAREVLNIDADSELAKEILNE